MSPLVLQILSYVAVAVGTWLLRNMTGPFWDLMRKLFGPSGPGPSPAPPSPSPVTPDGGNDLLDKLLDALLKLFGPSGDSKKLALAEKMIAELKEPE